jgi:hypothetical protein
MNTIAITLITLFLGTPSVPEPAECCATPEAAVEAYFSEISSGPGPRDWGTMKGLLLEHAQFSAVGLNAKRENELFVQGSTEYLHHLGEYSRIKGFFQREVCRSLYNFGRLASTVSVYESRNAPEGKIIDRGIVAIHLLSDGRRWSIASVAWHSESREAVVDAKAHPPGCRAVSPKSGG